jgi:hypothetical protein
MKEDFKIKIDPLLARSGYCPPRANRHLNHASSVTRSTSRILSVTSTASIDLTAVTVRPGLFFRKPRNATLYKWLTSG